MSEDLPEGASMLSVMTSGQNVDLPRAQNALKLTSRTLREQHKGVPEGKEGEKEKNSAH